MASVNTSPLIAGRQRGGFINAGGAPAGPTFITTYSGTGTNLGTPVTWVTGSHTGKYLVAYCYNNISVVFNTPAGWTLISENLNVAGGGSCLSIYGRFDDGIINGVTFTNASTSRNAVVVGVYAGVDTGTPFTLLGAAQFIGVSTAVYDPADEVVASGATLVTGMGRTVQSVLPVITGGIGMAARGYASATSTDRSVIIADKIIVVGGTIDNGTWTFGGTTFATQICSIQLNKIP